VAAGVGEGVGATEAVGGCLVAVAVAAVELCADAGGAVAGQLVPLVEAERAVALLGVVDVVEPQSVEGGVAAARFGQV
jgi:hypothetical protein